MLRTLRAVRFLFVGPMILALLFVINLMTSPGHWWVQWAALGIGIAWIILSFIGTLTLAKYLGGKQEDLSGIGVFGDPGLLDVVVKDPLGIGYNNLGYAFDNASGAPVAGSVAVPIDVNENGVADPDEILETKTEAIEAVASGKYPSPPARPLNLVTNGKPSSIIQKFIEWILTDGQQFVGEAGYVQLTADQLNEAIQKIK